MEEILKKKNLALVAAVVDRDSDTVAAQLRGGANIHYEDDFPLRCAIYLGYRDMAELLLKSGANVHANAEEPLFIAIKARDNAMIDLLLGKGANLKAVLNNNKGKLDQASLDLIGEIQSRVARAAAEKHARDLREKAWQHPRPAIRPRPV